MAPTQQRSRRDIVERWAAHWASGAEGSSDCYAPAAVSTVVDSAGCVVLHGRADIARDGAAGALRVPDRVVHLRHAVEGDRVVVAEWLFAGRSAEDLVAMAAPGVCWWELDGDGRIEREWRVVDWASRRILDGHSFGGVTPADPPADRSADAQQGRSQRWYREFVERFVEVADFDAELARRSIYAAEAVITAIAPPPARIEQAAMPRLRGVVGCDRWLAVLLEDPAAVQSGGVESGVVVVGLDDSDRICVERSYGNGWWRRGTGDETG